ncbi:hypothetical protein LOC67_21605 [Stieleria sp. JC731]|uniref:hypothetical protein n=1 Tax=Pirellulaceae TaxID=2691357 RepID=UPI001E2CDA06|nr:hypothetical protein [Stieleria sp. JC731]MCC9603154.1 hypothetical protein [Stieleria sp. JC731]
MGKRTLDTNCEVGFGLFASFLGFTYFLQTRELSLPSLAVTFRPYNRKDSPPEKIHQLEAGCHRQYWRDSVDMRLSLVRSMAAAMTPYRPSWSESVRQRSSLALFRPTQASKTSRDTDMGTTGAAFRVSKTAVAHELH